MVTVNLSWNLDESIRNFLDISLVGASIVNPEGIIVYANESLAELFKTETELMVGRSAAEFYAEPSDRFSIIDELLKNKQVKNKVVELKRDDNSTFFGSLSFFLSEYAGINHYFCLFYDLTERIKIEEDLKFKAKQEAKIEHLERLVKLSSRTADQINNPLTIIQGLYHVINAELEKPEPDHHRIQQMSQKIESAIGRIAEYVRELNKISKE